MILRRIAAAVLVFAVSSVQAETLTIAGGSFPEPWGNPFSSTSITRLPVWSALFDPLTFVTADGTLEPWLAENWARDGATGWRFALRNGVVFSNGEPVTAHSFAAAIEYLTTAQGRASPVGRELFVLASARALDPLTLHIETSSPDPLLPYKLALLRPLAARQWAADGPEVYFADPPGTGPYVFTDIGPTRSTLTANDASWRHAPAQTLDFIVLPEPAARQAALATGEADIAISALSPDEFDAVRADGGSVFVDRIPAVVTLSYITAGQAESPLADERVRAAIIHAVNRQAIVDVLMRGETRVANQPAPSNAFGYAHDIEGRAYDPERARILLREAGYEDGFRFAMEMPSGAVSYTDVFQQAAADLARVGIDLEVRTVPNSRFLEYIQTGEWNADAMAMPMFTPVSDALYPMRQNSCLWHAVYYCDPAAVPLIENAMAATGIDARRTATEAVMRHSHDTAQSLFMYETVAFIGLSKRIKAFRSDFGFIRYEDIELAD